ncbi:hypothetical protein A3Q56_01984 [Intoshia linei]|uniref:UDP-N-acetylglucosamine--dolichyl-phosphate N-acetylglucosaminephosphotransferase n=1 Tax=Intoshia linei TaxID=1819745 RepID=A0A177B7Z7_9BILA|nr:hypothetical protein A3Q56_01984 [Intoshia linei]
MHVKLKKIKKKCKVEPIRNFEFSKENLKNVLIIKEKKIEDNFPIASINRESIIYQIWCVIIFLAFLYKIFTIPFRLGFTESCSYSFYCKNKYIVSFNKKLEGLYGIEATEFNYHDIQNVNEKECSYNFLFETFLPNNKNSLKGLTDQAKLDIYSHYHGLADSFKYYRKNNGSVTLFDHILRNFTNQDAITLQKLLVNYIIITKQKYKSNAISVENVKYVTDINCFITNYSVFDNFWFYVDIFTDFIYIIDIFWIFPTVRKLFNGYLKTDVRFLYKEYLKSFQFKMIFDYNIDFFIILLAITYILTYHLWKSLPTYSKMLIDANIYGIDMNKTSKIKISEGTGVFAAIYYIIILFLCIPIYHYFVHSAHNFLGNPFEELIQFLTILLSVTSITLLGFIDDVLDLKWKHKMCFPLFASIPLLMVYRITFDQTSIKIPWPLRFFTVAYMDIGILYYVFMSMLIIFSTNAVNILAGVNGIEVGQSIIIAIFIIIYEMVAHIVNEFSIENAILVYMITFPFIIISVPLYRMNKYPAKIFVGDTYCYFAGVLFSSVSIIGHFSKTLLLLMVPQIINFLFSCPQIFKFLPCPRHRLPKLNKNTNLLEMSMASSNLQFIGNVGRFILYMFYKFGLVHVKIDKRDFNLKIYHFFSDKNDSLEFSNFTIIVAYIRLFGPTHEKILVRNLLIFQVC